MTKQSQFLITAIHPTTYTTVRRRAWGSAAVDRAAVDQIPTAKDPAPASTHGLSGRGGFPPGLARSMTVS